MRLGKENCLAGLLAPEQQNAASVNHPTIKRYQYHRKMAIQQYQRNTRTKQITWWNRAGQMWTSELRLGREEDELESGWPISREQNHGVGPRVHSGFPITSLGKSEWTFWSTQFLSGFLPCGNTGLVLLDILNFQEKSEIQIFSANPLIFNCEKLIWVF